MTHATSSIYNDRTLSSSRLFYTRSTGDRQKLHCNSNSEQARAYSKVGPHSVGAASTGLQEDRTRTHRPASRQDPPGSLTPPGNAASGRSREGDRSGLPGAIAAMDPRPETDRNPGSL